MKNVIIFGAGATGKRIYDDINKSVNVLGFVDNSQQKWGGTSMVNQYMVG